MKPEDEVKEQSKVEPAVALGQTSQETKESQQPGKDVNGSPKGPKGSAKEQKVSPQKLERVAKTPKKSSKELKGSAKELAGSAKGAKKSAKELGSSAKEFNELIPPPPNREVIVTSKKSKKKKKDSMATVPVGLPKIEEGKFLMVGSPNELLNGVPSTTADTLDKTKGSKEKVSSAEKEKALPKEKASPKGEGKD